MRCFRLLRTVLAFLAFAAGTAFSEPAAAPPLAPLPAFRMNVVQETGFRHPLLFFETGLLNTGPLFDVVFVGGTGVGGGGGVSWPLSDETFQLKDNGDATKKWEVELTGVTTGNTVVTTLTGTAANPGYQLGTSFWLLRSNAADAAVVASGGIGVGTGQFWFGSSISGTDAGIQRVSAAKVKITDGSTGLGNLQVRAGTGTTTAEVGGVVCSGTPNATTSGTTEEVIATCPLSANTIAASYLLYLDAVGVTAANGNNKTVRVRIGASGSCLTGAVIFTSGTQTWNNLIWTIDRLKMFRLSSTTFSASGQIVSSAKGGTATLTATGWQDDTETTDFTTARDVCITFETATAAGGLTLNTYQIGVR